MSERRIGHGTRTGYLKCVRREEGACDACKKSGREYMSNWRKSNPEKCAGEREKDAARHRALWKLAKKHRADFEELYRREMAVSR